MLGNIVYLSIITEQALSPQFFYILRNHRLSNTPFLSNIPIALCISFGLIVRRDLQERHHPTIKKMRNIPRFLLVESNLLLVIGVNVHGSVEASFPYLHTNL